MKEPYDRGGPAGAAKSPLRPWSCDDGRTVAIVVAVAMVVLLGFCALVIDIGQIIIVKSELQNAADTGALAGVVDLVNVSEPAAQTTAVTYATQADNFHLTSPSPAADAVVVVVLDPETLQVQVRRTSGTAAGPVNTLFARIWSVQTAGVESIAVATVNRQIVGTGPGNLMPFGINEILVDQNLDGNFDVGNEVNIYPYDYSPGNFGLLDLDGGSNSNAETKNWIEHGFDDNFIIPESPGYVIIEGDPGISGGSLDSSINLRIDDMVVFPIFDKVWSQGANTKYQVIKLMGGVITGFKLTGPQSKRKIMVKITDFSTNNLIAGSSSVPLNNSLALPVLIR